MKKALFAALAGAVVLAGCAKTEVVETSDSVNIRFDNAYVGNPTKATINQVTKDQFNNFYVLAYTNENANFFNNEKVYQDNGVYTYDVLKKWAQNAGYHFAAYSNGGYNAETDGKLEGVTFADESLEIADYTVDNANRRDLVVAISTTDLENNNTPVGFTFQHALAMVKFTIINGLGNNAIEITDFQVVDVPNTATMTLTKDAASVAWGATTANTTFTSEDFTSVANGEGESDEFVVIPSGAQTNLQITFTATVTPTNGGDASEETLTATIENYDWKPGFRYNYEATITAQDMKYIEFADPEVTEWGAWQDVTEDID